MALQAPGTKYYKIKYKVKNSFLAGNHYVLKGMVQYKKNGDLYKTTFHSDFIGLTLFLNKIFDKKKLQNQEII